MSCQLVALTSIDAGSLLLGAPFSDFELLIASNALNKSIVCPVDCFLSLGCCCLFCRLQPGVLVPEATGLVGLEEDSLCCHERRCRLVSFSSEEFAFPAYSRDPLNPNDGVRFEQRRRSSPQSKLRMLLRLCNLFCISENVMALENIGCSRVGSMARQFLKNIVKIEKQAWAVIYLKTNCEID